MNFTSSNYSDDISTTPVLGSTLNCKRRSPVNDIFVGKYYVAVHHERVNKNKLVQQVLIFKIDEKGNIKPNIYYAVPLDYNQKIQFFIFEQVDPETEFEESYLATFDAEEQFKAYKIGKTVLTFDRELMEKDKLQELVEENDGYIPKQILAREQEILKDFPNLLSFEFNNMVISDSRDLKIHYLKIEEKSKKKLWTILTIFVVLLTLMVSLTIFYCKKWLKMKEIELLEWDERDLQTNRYYSSKSFFFSAEEGASKLDLTGLNET